MIEIDKNVPLSAKNFRGGRPSIYPWESMQVGDSFFVSMRQVKFANQITRARKRYSAKYTTRSVDGGTRVWRVE